MNPDPSSMKYAQFKNGDEHTVQVNVAGTNGSRGRFTGTFLDSSDLKPSKDRFQCTLTVGLVVAGVIVCTAAAISIALLFYDQHRLTSELNELRSQGIKPDVTLKKKLEQLESVFNDYSQFGKNGPGTTYIRWGRTTCNNESNATLVYKGSGAGSTSYSSDRAMFGGGGVNYLCLPPDPEYNKWDKAEDDLARVWIYGAEYQSMRDVGIFDSQIHGGDVPCSVCHVPRSAKLIIPGKRNCYDGWTKEYEGYLMSSQGNQHKSTFECVDHRPEILPGTQNVTGGALFYFVATYCAGPPAVYDCPQYVNAREITCVVCTK